ncbi:MAG TPA: response regulator transcription factor [Candidatus Angelobacter sp.]
MLVAASSARRVSLSALAVKNFRHGDLEVVTSSTLSSGRVGRVADSFADIILADIDGPSLAASLVRFKGESASAAGTVALINDPDPRWVQAAVKAGINAVISREPSGDELHLALAAADAGLVLLHPTSARGLVAAHLQPSDLTYDQERLTAREFEVLRLLSDGLGNKEIASRLAISEHTAKFHISSILGKLSVATRTEAVSQGIRRGLIPI